MNRPTVEEIKALQARCRAKYGNTPHHDFVSDEDYVLAECYTMLGHLLDEITSFREFTENLTYASEKDK